MHKLNSRSIQAKELTFLQIIHSHPLYEVYSGEHELIYPLNGTDLDSASQQLSNRYKIPALVTAVSRNGYSYHSIVYGQENITSVNLKEVANYIDSPLH